MSQKDVPVKTDAGVWEIKARALGLAPRIRTALLLVDGVKSATELERMMQAAGVTPGALQLLLDKGLIRFSGNTVQQAESEQKRTMLMEPMTLPRPAPKTVVEARPPAQESASNANPLEVVTLSEIETILGVATEMEVQTIIGVATKLEATPSQLLTDTVTQTPRKEKPTAKEQAQRASRAIDEAEVMEKQVISSSILKMNLIVARAHIANALDQYLEVDGYVLRQKVAACESRADLERLFGLVETALQQKMDKAAVARLMGISRALLER